MKQTTEDYVSFEIAQLLKEKGVDFIECVTYYCEDKPRKIDYSFCGETNSTWEKRCCQAPTHQMALKLLREVYNIFIEVNVSVDLNGSYHFNYSILDKECKYIKRFVGYYSTHELCVEAAILYVLKNLI